MNSCRIRVGKYLGIRALSLSLSLQVRGWPVNWKNYSCYMYGFGDRIVRGGRHVAILFDQSEIATVVTREIMLGERVPYVDSRGLSFVGFATGKFKFSANGRSNFPLMVEFRQTTTDLFYQFSLAGVNRPFSDDSTGFE